jgi:RNA polymerase subunit RPABC4/transcription elongation factor Spt4
MSYACQFCGEIEETEVHLRCSACNGENVARGSLGMRCDSCGDIGKAVTAVCPTCGSDELEQ